MEGGTNTEGRRERKEGGKGGGKEAVPILGPISPPRRIFDGKASKWYVAWTTGRLPDPTLTTLSTKSLPH
ncbi:hypothetical protein E2C01_063903 [Portunus trituberculatus]|uniref:Uncharacterized protein n=1 Tax=Portunus trituberculatus TaxID=210409 RepID=A0A5B7HHP2_PORTR|nr:hypothetical protein [Portunus trituberculatus]